MRPLVSRGVLRLFVAIPLPTDVATALARSLPDELPALRRVAPDLLHVTLAFIGAVGEDRLDDVTAAVAAAAAGATAFPIAFTVLGRFPERGSPRIVWAGTSATGEIEALGTAVRDSLARRGIPFDPKPLRAHVTLARVRDEATSSESAAVERAVATARIPAGAAFTADAVHVVQSVLSRSGPRYSSRARVALAGSGRSGGPQG